MECTKRRRTEAAAGLPDDPLVEILSRVPFKSLCRFKCVSKAWRDVIADPLHRENLPQTLEGFFFMLEKHSRVKSGVEDCDSNEGDDGGRCTDCRGNGEELPQGYGFVDVLQRSVRHVDFSYLTEQPDIENTRLLHCCNGLLLFAVECNYSDFSWSYVVCNPATEQCVTVPSSGLKRDLMLFGDRSAYLFFDPGACRHFSVVQLSQEGYMGHRTSVHVYSSKTQAWSHSKCDWGFYAISPYSPGVYFNGMLHLVSSSGIKHQLLAVDVEGNIQKIIPAPCQAGREYWLVFDYIGQSQGCLHYINRGIKFDDDGIGFPEQSCLLIWVLEDHDREQWVLKDTVSFLKLFGESNCHGAIDYRYEVVGIHPDRSLVFLVLHQDRKLISYDMDSKEVCDLCTLGHDYDYECITPYVPYFSKLLALQNKQ